jgi:hypothetical protein
MQKRNIERNAANYVRLIERCLPRVFPWAFAEANTSRHGVVVEVAYRTAIGRRKE